ncbi:hypothetical protein CSUI_001567 [Cystoisospora suis]|uniref:Uncharacterized protein n=1 Tax=Cystoisospora suis TaxID=483139 RepID=A0A2C6LB95_9APIC|nr:hypothetical protein CSUI_001567 [Cystoisospora suis]
MWRGKDACEGGGQWCEGREVRASGANWLKGGQPTYSLDHPNVWRPRMRGRRFFCCPWCSCFESEPVIYRVQDAGGGGWGETNDGAAWQVRVSLFSAPALATARCSGGQQEREREGTSDGDRLGGGREKESLDQVTRLYEGEGTHQGESACSHGQHPVEHQLTLHISAERVEAGTPVPPPVSQSPPLVYESFDDNADGGAFCDRVRDVPGDLPPHFQRSSTKWSRCLLGCCGGVVAPRRCRDGRCVHSRRRGCLRCPKKSLDGCSPSLWKHRGGVREQAGQETVGMNGESREVTGEVKEGTHAHGGSQERGQLCKTREGHTSLSPTGSASLCGEDREDCCPDGAFHKEQTVPPEVESGSLTGESRSLSSHFAAKGSERRCRSRNSVVSFAADDVNDGNVEGKVGGRSGTEGGAGDLSGYSSASLRAFSSSSNMNASASSPCCCGLGGRGSAWNSPVRRRGRSFGAVSTLETGGGYPCPEKKGGDGARSPASPPELYVHWGVCIDSPTEWRTPPERLVSSESFLDRASHAVRTPFVKLTKSDARSVPQEDPRISREPQERQRHSCKEGEPSSFEEELTSCDCVFVNESTGGGHVREKGGGTKQVMEGSMVKEGLDRSSVVREEVKEGGTRSQDTNSGGNCVCLLDSSHTGKQDGEEWESAEERAGAEQRQHSFECDCFPNFSDNAVRPFPSLACPICFSSSPPPWVADSASSSSSSSSSSQSPCPGVSPATIYCMQLPLGTTTGSHADTPQGIQFVLFSPPGRWIKPRDDSNFVFNIYQAIGHIQLRIASFFLRRVLLCSPPLYHSSSSACSFIKKSKKERGPATGEHKDKTISRSPRPNLAVRRQEEDSVSACSAAPLAPCELSDSDLAAACLSWKEKGESTYLRGVARRRSFPLVSSRSAHRGCSFPSCFQSYVSTSRLSTRAAQSRRRVLSPPLHGASSDPSLLSSYKAAEESSSSSCSPCSSSLPLSESRHAIRTWAWSLPKRFCDASSRKETTKEGAMTAETSCAALAERTVAADPVSISLNEVFSSSPSEVWSSNLSSLSFSPPVYREGTATGPRCLSDPVLSRSDMTSTQFPSSQLSSSRLSSLHSCSPDNAGITSAFHTSSGGKVQSLPSSSSLPWLSTSPTPSPLPTSRHSQRLSHHSGATGLPSQNWRLEHAAVREFAVSEAGCFPPHKSSELCLSAACFVRWGDLSSQRCSFFVKSRVFPGEEGDSHQVDPSQELLCLQAILSYDKLPTSSGRSREGGRGGGEETCRVVWGNVSGPAQRRGHRKGAVEEGLGVLRSFESPQQACSAAEENKTINERSSQQTNGSLTSKTLSASHVEGRQRGLEKSQDEVMQGRYSGYCGTGFEARRTKEEVRDAYMDKLKTREDYEEEKTTTSCVLTIGQPGASWESAKQELQCCQSPERGWKGGTLDEQSLGNEDKQKAMKCGPTLRELCNGVAYPLFYGCRRYADHGITGENKGREKENEDWLEKSLRCEACLHLGSHCHCESISLDSPLDFLAVSRRTFLLGSSRPPTLFRGRKSQHLHPFSSSFSPASKVRRRSTPDGGLSLDDAFKRKRRSSELSCPSSEGGESLSLHDGGVQGQSTQYRPVVQLYLTTGSESEKGEVEGPLLILTSLPLPGAIPIRSANVESLSSSSSFVFSVSRDEGQHSTSSTHKRRLPFLLRLRSRTTKSGDEGKEEGTATDSFERTDEDADEAFVFENDFAEEEPATGTCVNISRRVYSCESWNTWGKTPGLVEGSITSEARQTEVAFSSLPCEEQQDLESHIQDSVECQGGAGDHDITRLPIPLSPSSPSGSSSHRSSSRSCRRSPLLLGHSFEENNVDTIGKEIHGDSLFSVALGHHGDNPNVLGEEGTDRDRICFAPWKAECGEFEQQAALEEEDTKETFEICAGNAQFDNDEGGSSLLSPSPAPVETDKDEMLGDDGEVGEDFFASRQQGAGGHEKEDYEANSWSKARNEREPFDLAEVGRVSGRTAVEKKGGGREGEGERFREAFTSHRQKREGEQNERKKSLFSRGLRRLVKRFLRERLPPVAPTTSLSFAGRRVIDIKRFQVTGEDDGREGSSPSSSSTDDDRHRGGTPLPAGGGEAEVAILEEPSVTGKSPYFLLRISVLLWEDNSSVLPRGPVSSSSSQLSAKGGCSFPSSSPSSLASASAFSPSEEKSFYAPSRVTENGLHCKAGGTGQSLDSQERSPHMNHIHSDSEGTHTSPVGVVDNHNLGGSSGCPSPPANGSSCFPYTTTSSSSVLWCHWGLHLAEETPAPERARRIVRDALATIAGLAVFPAFASSHGVGNFFQPSCMGPFHTCGHSSIPIDFLHNISHVLSTMAPPSPKSCRTVSCTSRREEDCGSCSQPPFGTGTIPQAFGERCDHPTTLLPRENEEITRPGASQEGGTHDGQWCAERKPTRGEGERRGCIGREEPEQGGYLSPDKTKNEDVSYFAWVQAPRHVWPEGSMPGDAASVDTPMKQVLVNERRTWLHYFSKRLQHRVRGSTAAEDQGNVTQGTEAGTEGERQQNNENSSSKDRSASHLSASDRQCSYSSCAGRGRDTSPFSSDSSSSDSGEDHCRIRLFSLDRGPGRNERREVDGEKTEAMMMLKGGGHVVQAETGSFSSAERDSGNEEDESSMALLKLHVLDLRLPTRVNGKKVTGFSFVLRSGPPAPCRWFHQRIMGASAGGCSSSSGLEEPRRGDFFVACERPRFHDFQQPQGIFSLSAISQQLHYLRQQFMYLLTSPPPLSIKSSLSFGLQATMLTARKGETTSATAGEGKYHTQHVLSAATAALLLHSPPAPSLFQQQRVIEMLVDASTFLNPPGLPSASLRPSLGQDRVIFRESLLKTKRDGHDNTAKEPHQVDPSDAIEGTPPNEDVCMAKSSRVQEASGCCQGHDGATCGEDGELHRQQRQGGDQDSSASFDLSRANDGRGGSASPASCDEAASLSQANVLGSASRHRDNGVPKGCWSGDGENDDRHLLPPGFCFPSVSPIPSSPAYLSSNSMKRDCFCPVCFERGGEDKAFFSSSSTSSTIVQCVVTILRLLEGGDQRTEDVGFWSWIFAFALLERFQWTQQQTMKYTKMFEKERTRADMEIAMKMKISNRRQHVGNPSGQNAAHHPLNGSDTSEPSVNVKEREAKASLTPKGGSFKNEESEGCQHQETEKEKTEEGEKEGQQKNVRKGQALSGHVLGEKNSLQVKRQETNKTVNSGSEVVSHQVPHSQDAHSSHPPSYTSSTQVNCASVTPQRRRSPSSEQNDGGSQRKNHTTMKRGSSNPSASTASQEMNIDCDSSMRDHLGSRHFLSPPLSSSCLPRALYHGTPQPRVPTQHPRVYFLCTPVIPPSALWLGERLLLLLTRFWREAVKCRPIIRMLIAVFAAPLVAGRILDELVRILHASRLAEREIFFRQWASRLRHNPSPLVDYLISPSSGFPSFASSFCNVNLDRAFSRTPQCSPWCRMNKSGTSPLVCDRQAEGSARNVERSEERDVRPTSSTLMGIRCVDASGESGMLRASLWYVESGGRSRWFWRGLGVAQRDLERLLETEARSKGEVGGLGSKNEETQERTQQHQHTENNVGNKEKTVPRRNSEVEWGHGPTSLSATGEGGSTREVAARGDYGEGKKEEDEEGKVLFDSSVVVSSVEARETESVEKGRESDDLAHENKKHGGEGSNSTNENDRKQGELTSAKDVADAGLSKASHQAFSTSSPHVNDEDSSANVNNHLQQFLPSCWYEEDQAEPIIDTFPSDYTLWQSYSLPCLSEHRNDLLGMSLSPCSPLSVTFRPKSYSLGTLLENSTQFSSSSPFHRVPRRRADVGWLAYQSMGLIEEEEEQGKAGAEESGDRRHYLLEQRDDFSLYSQPVHELLPLQDQVDVSSGLRQCLASLWLLLRQPRLHLPSNFWSSGNTGESFLSPLEMMTNKKKMQEEEKEQELNQNAVRCGMVYSGLAGLPISVVFRFCCSETHKAFLPQELEELLHEIVKHRCLDFCACQDRSQSLETSSDYDDDAKGTTTSSCLPSCCPPHDSTVRTPLPMSSRRSSFSSSCEELFAEPRRRRRSLDPKGFNSDRGHCDCLWSYCSSHLSEYDTTKQDEDTCQLEASPLLPPALETYTPDRCKRGGNNVAIRLRCGRDLIAPSPPLSRWCDAATFPPPPPPLVATSQKSCSRTAPKEMTNKQRRKRCSARRTRDMGRSSSSFSASPEVKEKGKFSKRNLDKRADACGPNHHCTSLSFPQTEKGGTKSNSDEARTTQQGVVEGGKEQRRRKATTNCDHGGSHYQWKSANKSCDANGDDTQCRSSGYTDCCCASLFTVVGRARTSLLPALLHCTDDVNLSNLLLLDIALDELQQQMVSRLLGDYQDQLKSLQEYGGGGVFDEAGELFGCWPSQKETQRGRGKRENGKRSKGSHRRAATAFYEGEDEEQASVETSGEERSEVDDPTEETAATRPLKNTEVESPKESPRKQKGEKCDSEPGEPQNVTASAVPLSVCSVEEKGQESDAKEVSKVRRGPSHDVCDGVKEEEDDEWKREEKQGKKGKKKESKTNREISSSSSSSSSGRTGSSKSSVSEGDSETPQKENEEKERLFSYPGGLESYHSPYPSPTKEKEESSLNSQCKVERRLRERLAQTLCWPPCVCALFPLLGRLLSGLVILHPWYEEVDALYNDWRFVMELYQHEVRDAEDKKVVMCQSKVLKERSEARKRFPSKTTCLSSTRGKKKNFSQRSPSLRGPAFRPPCSFLGDGERGRKKSQEKEERNSGEVHVSRRSFENVRSKENFPRGRRRRCSFEERGCGSSPQLTKKADKKRRSEEGGERRERPGTAPSFLLRKELPSSLLFLVAVLKRLERCIMRLVGLCDEYCRGKLAFFVEARGGSSSLSSDLIERCVETSVLHSLGLVLQQLSLSLCFYYPSLSSAVSFLPTSCSTAAAGAMVFLPSLSSADKIPPPPFPLILATSHFDEANDRLPPYARAILLCPSSGAFLRRVAAPVLLRRLECFLMQDMEGQGDAVRVTGHQGTREREQEKEDEVWNEWSREENDGDDDMVFEEQRQIPHSRQLAYEKGDRRWGRSGRTRRRWVRELYTEGDMADVFGGPCKEEDGVEDLGDASAPPLFENCELNSKGKDTSRREGTKDYERRKGGHVFHQTGAGVNGSLLQSVDPSWTLGELLIAAAAGTAASRLSSGSSSAWLSPLKFYSPCLTSRFVMRARAQHCMVAVHTDPAFFLKVLIDLIIQRKQQQVLICPSSSSSSKGLPASSSFFSAPTSRTTTLPTPTNMMTTMSCSSPALRAPPRIGLFSGEGGFKLKEAEERGGEKKGCSCVCHHRGRRGMGEDERDDEEEDRERGGEMSPKEKTEGGEFGGGGRRDDEVRDHQAGDAVGVKNSRRRKGERGELQEGREDGDTRGSDEEGRTQRRHGIYRWLRREEDTMRQLTERRLLGRCWSVCASLQRMRNQMKCLIPYQQGEDRLDKMQQHHKTTFSFLDSCHYHYAILVLLYLGSGFLSPAQIAEVIRGQRGDGGLTLFSPFHLDARRQRCRCCTRNTKIIPVCKPNSCTYTARQYCSCRNSFTPCRRLLLTSSSPSSLLLSYLLFLPHSFHFLLWVFFSSFFSPHEVLLIQRDVEVHSYLHGCALRLRSAPSLPNKTKELLQHLPLLLLISHPQLAPLLPVFCRRSEASSDRRRQSRRNSADEAAEVQALADAAAAAAAAGEVHTDEEEGVDDGGEREDEDYHNSSLVGGGSLNVTGAAPFHFSRMPQRSFFGGGRGDKEEGDHHSKLANAGHQLLSADRGHHERGASTSSPEENQQQNEVGSCERSNEGESVEKRCESDQEKFKDSSFVIDKEGGGLGGTLPGEQRASAAGAVASCLRLSAPLRSSRSRRELFFRERLLGSKPGDSAVPLLFRKRRLSPLDDRNPFPSIGRGREETSSAWSVSLSEHRSSKDDTSGMWFSTSTSTSGECDSLSPSGEDGEKEEDEGDDHDNDKPEDLDETDGVLNSNEKRRRKEKGRRRWRDSAGVRRCGCCRWGVRVSSHGRALRGTRKEELAYDNVEENKSMIVPLGRTHRDALLPGLFPSSSSRGRLFPSVLPSILSPPSSPLSFFFPALEKRHFPMSCSPSSSLSPSASAPVASLSLCVNTHHHPDTNNTATGTTSPSSFSPVIIEHARWGDPFRVPMRNSPIFPPLFEALGDSHSTDYLEGEADEEEKFEQAAAVAAAEAAAAALDAPPAAKDKAVAQARARSSRRLLRRCSRSRHRSQSAHAPYHASATAPPTQRLAGENMTNSGQFPYQQGAIGEEEEEGGGNEARMIDVVGHATEGGIRIDVLKSKDDGLTENGRRGEEAGGGVMRLTALSKRDDLVAQTAEIRDKEDANDGEKEQEEGQGEGGGAKEFEKSLRLGSVIKKAEDLIRSGRCERFRTARSGLSQHYRYGNFSPTFSSPHQAGGKGGGGRWLVGVEGFQPHLVGPKGLGIAMLRQSPVERYLAATAAVPFDALERTLRHPVNRDIRRQLQHIVAALDIAGEMEQFRQTNAPAAAAIAARAATAVARAIGERPPDAASAASAVAGGETALLHTVVQLEKLLRRARQLIRVLHLPPEAFRDLHVFCSCPANNEKHDGETHSLMRGDGDFTDGGTGGCQNHDERLYRHPRPNSKQEWVGTRGGNGMEEEKESAHMRGDPGRGMITRDQDKIRKTTFDGQGAGATGNEEEKEGDQKDTRERTATDRKSPSNTGYRDVFVGGRGTQGNRGRRGVFLGDLAQEKKKTMWEQKQNKLKALLQQNPERLWSCVKNVWCTLFSPSVVLAVQRARLRFSQVRICVLLQLVEGVCEASFLCRTDVGNLCKRTLNSNGSPDQEGECHIRSSSSTHETEDDEYDTSCSSGRQRRGSNSSGGSCSSCSSYTGSSLVRHPTEPSSSSRYPCPLHEPKRRPSLRSCSSSRSSSSLADRQKGRMAINSSLGEGNFVEEEAAEPSPMHRCGTILFCREHDENLRKTYSGDTERRTNEMSAEEASSNRRTPVHQASQSTGRPRRRSGEKRHPSTECLDTLEDQSLSATQGPDHGDEDDQGSDVSSTDMNESFPHQKAAARKELYGEVVLGFCLAPRELIEGGSVGPGVPLLFRAEYTPPPDLSPSVWDERVSDDKDEEDRGGSFPSLSGMQDSVIVSPETEVYPSREGARKEEEGEIKGGDDLEFEIDRERVESKEQFTNEGLALETEESEDLDVGSPVEGKKHRVQASSPKDLVTHFTDTLLTESPRVPDERCETPEAKIDTSGLGDQRSPQPVPFTGNGSESSKEIDQGDVSSSFRWRKKSGALTARETVTEEASKKEEAPRRCASHPHHQPAVRFQIPPSSAAIEGDEGGQKDVSVRSDGLSQWKGYTGKAAFPLDGDRRKASSFSFAGDANSKLEPSFCPLCHCETVDPPGKGCSCMETPSGARISQPFVEGFPSKSTTLRFSRPCVLVSADLNVEGLESLMAVDGVIACVQQEIEEPNLRRPSGFSQNQMTTPPPSLRLIPSKSQQSRGDSAAVLGGVVRGGGSVPRDGIFYLAARPRGEVDDGTLPGGGAATPGLRVVGTAVPGGRRKGTPLGSGGASAPVVPAVGWLSYSGGMTPGGRAKTCFSGGERTGGLLLRPPGGVGDHRGVAIESGVVTPLTGGSIPRRHRLEYHREKWLMDSEWRERHLLEAAATAVEAERALGFPQIVCGMWVKPCIGDGNSSPAEEPEDGDNEALVVLSSRCVPVVEGCEEDSSLLGGSRTI